MSTSEQRQIGRDSLFVLASLRLTGEDVRHSVKLRNISSGGAMAEGDVRVTRGAAVQVEIRNLGWVEGVVAWVQDNRFGIAFCDEIDPLQARAPVKARELPALCVPRPALAAPGIGRRAETLRKI